MCRMDNHTALAQITWHPVSSPDLTDTSWQVQPGDKALSRWLLSTRQFNRDWQIAWLAKNLTPTRNQKIHWRSVPVSHTAAHTYRLFVCCAYVVALVRLSSQEDVKALPPSLSKELGQYAITSAAHGSSCHMRAE